MKYFFPIKINDRRIHICELQEDYTPQNPFEFIISKAERTLLFSIPVTGAKLLSNQGYKGNIQLSKLTPILTRKESQQEEYLLDLYNKEAKERHKNESNKPTAATKANGQGLPVVISNWGNRNCAVMIDRTIMQANTSFTFTICYHHGEKVGNNAYRERVFSYSFTVHYCEAALVKQAALDFGSEASQAREGGNEVNMLLVNLMKGLLPNNQNAQNNTTDYWQEGDNNNFFKSVFFLCTKPQRPIEEADTPNIHGEKTFVQTLVSKTATLNKGTKTAKSNKETKTDDSNKETQTDDSNKKAKTDDSINLFILPNLKLLDALRGNRNLNQHQITLEGGQNDAITRKGINARNATLGTNGMSDLILEILLNNFMHCILRQLTNDNPTFLRLNMLMPNVYPQNKVYRVVKGLYAGFNAMKNKYSCFKGVEIQVLSESDAAFLGVRTVNEWGNQNQKIINKENGYFLVIDAGKGTTDFSILRQQENCNVFDSVYRSGIPISGNYITYAFYEAVRDFCNQQGITLNDKLSDALKGDRAKLLEFVDNIEQLKRNYNPNCTQTAAPLPNIQTKNDLASINSHLKTIIKNNQKLPNIDTYVKNAVKKIVDWVTDELNLYCKNHSVQFVQVMFTGRGFLFPPLREAMETKLKEMKLMREGEKEKALFFDNDLSKSICLSGAFLLDNCSRINQNSEMVGVPVVDSQSPGFLAKLFGINRVDEKFFYTGIRISTTQPTIYVSGNQYQATENDKHEKRLLFVGNGFLLQYSDSADLFQTDYTRRAKDKDVNRSLFPFFEGSIPETETIAGQGQQNDVVTNAAEQGQPNDGGSNAAEQGQTLDIDDILKAKAEESEDKPGNPIF